MKPVRTTWLFALAALGCAPAVPRDSFAEVQNVLDIVRLNPIGEGEAVKVTPISESAERTVNVVQARGPLKPHYHVHSDETVYVIQGRGILRAGSQTFELKPGDVLTIPRGMVHAYTPQGPETTVVLSVFTPRFQTGDRIFVER